jgi:hypothetical protein
MKAAEARYQQGSIANAPLAMFLDGTADGAVPVSNPGAKTDPLTPRERRDVATPDFRVLPGWPVTQGGGANGRQSIGLPI